MTATKLRPSNAASGENIRYTLKNQVNVRNLPSAEREGRKRFGGARIHSNDSLYFDTTLFGFKNRAKVTLEAR